MPDDSPGSGRPDDQRESPGPARGRSPGWGEVIAVAIVVVVAVFAVEFATTQVGALQDLFLRTPFTIVVLVAGTILVLAFALVRRRAGG